MPCDIYEALWIFMIYSFIGWCVEVSYVGLGKGYFVNRGFLNGPYCPIYGLGVLSVVIILTPLKDNLLLLFVGSFVLTTVLEYITGFILEKVFGNKWWDYSDLPFNIHGYVCLKHSIFWGLGCMFIMNIIHPVIYGWIRWIPRNIGIVILVIFGIAFIADICVTVNTILKFNRKLKLLEMMAETMHKLSDEIGEDIYEKVSEVADKTEEVGEYLQDSLKDRRLEIREKQLELESLKETYAKKLEEKHFGFKRLTKAFPDMKSIKHNPVLQQYKEFLNKKINHK